MKQLAFFLLAFACIACGDNEQGQPELENPFYISLSNSEIATDFSGVQKRIEVASNCDWSVGEMPEWCTVRKVVADDKEYLDVEIRPSDAEVPRRATVLLIAEQITAELSIAQGGRGQINDLQWYTFPVNFFTVVKFKLLQNKVTRSYQITGQKTFVWPSFRGQVFTGNLINNLIETVNLTDYYDDYTFNPITISSFGGGVKELPKPSFEGMDELVQQIITDLPEQSVDFYASSPMQYNSYRHLRLLGVGNMGINLDELISGKPYSEQEMEKKTGMIYTYSHELFSVVMDYPVDGELIKEKIELEKLSNMSYINSVSYGKTGLLLVESDYGFNAVKSIVTKIIENQSLNEEELPVKNDLAVWYVYFDHDGVHAVKGDAALIKRYMDEMKTLSGIIPLSFTTNKLEDNSVGNMEIEFELP